MDSNNYIGKALDELYRVFSELNKKYYNNELPIPMITIQTASKRKKENGWFSLEKVWKSISDTSEERHEINICAERLKDGNVEIAETLNHEMVHFYNRLAEIKDYCGKRHNKKFKIQAEKVGLVCEKHEKFGFVSSPSSEFITFILHKVKIEPKIFDYFRSSEIVVTQRKESIKRTFKYHCPVCGEEIKGKKNVPIICGMCNVQFEMDEE